MIPNEKKTLEYLKDQNEELKQQRNLLREMVSLYKQNQASVYKLGTNLEDEVKTLLEMKTAQERINQGKSIETKISNELKLLEAARLNANRERTAARLTGRTRDYQFWKDEWNHANRQVKNTRNIIAGIKEIIERNKDLVKGQKLIGKLEQENDWLRMLGLNKYTSGISNAMGQFAILMGKNQKQTNQLLRTLVKFQYPVIVSVLLLTKLWEIFKEIDKAAAEARMEIGMMRRDHVGLRSQAEEIYLQYLYTGVALKNIYETQKQIALELGGAVGLSKDLTTQISITAAQFKVSEETSVKFVKTLAQMGQSIAEAQTNMIGFTRAYTNATGIPLPQVMDDIAKASNETKMFMAKVPLEMIKAAVEARRLGTTLDKMASSSRKLLNFTESIESEMEASVLLGTPINLQLARQLSYHGKILEANEEILRLTKQIRFEDRDIYAKEAYAKATGKTVDELLSMLQAERQQIYIRNAANDAAQKGNLELRTQLSLMEDLKKVNKENAESLGKSANYLIKIQSNQETIVAIGLAWKQIVASIGIVFLPWIRSGLESTLEILTIILPVVKFVGEAFAHLLVPLTIIRKLLLTFPSFFSPIIYVLKLTRDIITGVFVMFGNWIVGTSIVQRIIGGLSRIMNITKTLSFLRPFVGFAKFIPGLGYVIMALSGIVSLVTRFSKIFHDLKSGTIGWGESIWEGFKALGGVIYDVLFDPFVSLYKWLERTFFGHSPSKVGLLIVKGISSIKDMMFDVLMYPFKKAWSDITYIFSGQVITDIIDSVSYLGNAMVSKFTSVVDYIKTGFKEGILGSIKETVDSAIALLNKTFGKIKNVFVPKRTRPQEQSANLSKGLLDHAQKAIDLNGTVKPVMPYENDVTAPLIYPQEENKDSTTSPTSIQPKDGESEKLYRELLSEIKGLREDYKAGVQIRLDSELVSLNLIRNGQFRNGYGVNQNS